MDPHKSISLFIPSMLGGGAERTMLNLAHGFCEHGFAVDLVMARAEGPFLAEIPSMVRTVDLGSSRVLKSLPALVDYLRHRRPQVMLSALRHTNIVALWARRLARVPTRVVVTEHNTLLPSLQFASRAFRGLMPRLIRYSYPWADEIVAVSKGVANDLVQFTGIPPERIHVIYNPVITPELREKMRMPLDHPWLQPDMPPVLLSVGRLTAQKDFPTLIRAFGQVRKNRDIRLLILGEGRDRSDLELLVKQLGLEQDVRMPGFVANPYPYLARASLFVLSSKWEGLPGVLIEALFGGIPLIATDCPGGTREILADGKYGQLIPVANIDALTRAIKRALECRPQNMPDESWRRFEPRTAVKKYIGLF